MSHNFALAGFIMTYKSTRAHLAWYFDTCRFTLNGSILIFQALHNYQYESRSRVLIVGGGGGGGKKLGNFSLYILATIDIISADHGESL